MDYVAIAISLVGIVLNIVTFGLIIMHERLEAYLALDKQRREEYERYGGWCGSYGPSTSPADFKPRLMPWWVYWWLVRVRDYFREGER